LLSRGLKAPSPHFALAFVAAVGYMVANGMSRKEGQRQNVLIVTAISTVMVLAALAIGLHAGGMM
jgi:hypothetical protein